MTQARMFARITKIDEAKREVWGRITQEVVDKSGEILDYAKSKPYFKAWSDSFREATDGKSLGNVRAMHGKVAAGKLIAIDFNDAEKAIDVGSKIIDDAEWAKSIEGVYTGFSIGGSYVGDCVTEKINGVEVRRFVADPTEVSLVDNPCVPTAQFFDVVKADGAIAKVAFKTPAEDTNINGTPEQVDEFAKLVNATGKSMTDVLEVLRKAFELPAPAANAAATTATPPAGAPVDKGMWNVQDFASCLACVASIAASAENDAEWEGDNSPVPEKLRTWLASGVAIFKEMAAEETAELLASLKSDAGDTVPMMLEMARATRDLRKLGVELDGAALTVARASEIAKTYDEPLGDGFAKRVLAKAGKADGHVQKMHDMLGDMGAKCTKDAAAPAPVAKTGESNVELTTVQAELAKATARIAALESQPVPYVTLRAISKAVAKAEANADPAAPALPKLERADYIYNADGSVDWAVSYMMKAQKLAAAQA